ncbi:11475_t:CDS:2 [Racocetra fulgida]|uniref:11475_t:CDS:1 n=1 Tax=Racocetra fulgida TaxID=60492 RepID=A0A9N9ANX3_9GLOM|nr:11475_t:CDS:2 [Racocetra fulgida]
MEDINPTELENNTDELYGLSDIEDVSTDEASDNLLHSVVLHLMNLQA